MQFKLTKTEYKQMRKRLTSLKESKDPEDVNLLVQLEKKAETYAMESDYSIDLEIILMWYLHLSIGYTPALLEQLVAMHEKVQKVN